MMQTTLSRSAHTDQVEAAVRDARCCDELDRCAVCQALADELRAARRDALIHALTTARPRRVVL